MANKSSKLSTNIHFNCYTNNEINKNRKTEKCCVLSQLVTSGEHNNSWKKKISGINFFKFTI